MEAVALARIGAGHSTPGPWPTTHQWCQLSFFTNCKHSDDKNRSRV